MVTLLERPWMVFPVPPPIEELRARLMLLPAPPAITEALPAVMVLSWPPPIVSANDPRKPPTISLLAPPEIVPCSASRPANLFRVPPPIVHQWFQPFITFDSPPPIVLREENGGTRFREPPAIVFHKPPTQLPWP